MYCPSYVPPMTWRTTWRPTGTKWVGPLASEDEVVEGTISDDGCVLEDSAAGVSDVVSSEVGAGVLVASYDVVTVDDRLKKPVKVDVRRTVEKESDVLVRFAKFVKLENDADGSAVVQLHTGAGGAVSPMQRVGPDTVSDI